MVGLKHVSRAALVAAALGLAGFPASAQELVYTPVNPSFGGDSFNSSHLLGIANAQNDYKDPDAQTTGNSQIDQFLRQLQSRLLSSLAAQVNDAIFGENPQESGTITFGDQTITFVRLLDSVSLTITDTATGAVTEISIPLLGDASQGDASGQIAALLGGSGEAATDTSDSNTGSLDDLDTLLSGQGDLVPGGG
ncbi:curli assembly protein CsgF [Hyphomonas sp.]|uniref:curli assembly protein CsgF n=1 Tax=Hyphomonas sp. TaxID=87 RepID=UPI00391A2872